VVLHLDHCKDLEVIRRCVEGGWSSVMIDASSKPFEENLELTAKVIEMARPAGVTVEAELGEIKGVEEEIAVSDSEARLADPEKAALFCSKLKLDLLAPAIGTAHGIYKGEPRIAFDRLEKIARLTGLPLALHGGTGLGEEVFRRCIALGCAKVNISTSLKHVFIDSFLAYHSAHAEEYEPIKYLGFQLQELKKDVVKHVRFFGGEGRA
jgi:ketose-bisphosphate aldolase